MVSWAYNHCRKETATGRCSREGMIWHLSWSLHGLYYCYLTLYKLREFESLERTLCLGLLSMLHVCKRSDSSPWIWNSSENWELSASAWRISLTAFVKGYVQMCTFLLLYRIFHKSRCCQWETPVFIIFICAASFINEKVEGQISYSCIVLYLSLHSFLTKRAFCNWIVQQDYCHDNQANDNF